jgi:hypothetical protein
MMEEQKLLPPSYLLASVYIRGGDADHSPPSSAEVKNE